MPIAVPTPPLNLNKLVRRVSWPKADIIHRVHPDKYLADQFNPGPAGNARFSPILDAKGNSIPTIYGGTTFDCAAMETVFHDVPFAPGLKTHAKRKLKAHHYSQVLSVADLTLAELTTTSLRKLGIKRAELIETEKNIYPQTRAWAEAIHAQCPDIQGYTGYRAKMIGPWRLSCSATGSAPARSPSTRPQSISWPMSPLTQTS
ncbi:RES family NAD+ phosphorylase [Sphingomonas sp. KC8]|uniref:RES family NAD+ phosphorylase n=1 Tax=Sphingomonas sp. KC8 TaxID=1030157 RepID=UPI000248AEE8|nr:RES family NAD+ phosphorylase [Sphingomonas sp. KC8]ARS28321.1 hypothetical protein KC8_13640 [Sphingomonas sp. KC8]